MRQRLPSGRSRTLILRLPENGRGRKLLDPALTANANELFEVFKHRELLAQATARALDELAQSAGVPVRREPVRL